MGNSLELLRHRFWVLVLFIIFLVLDIWIGTASMAFVSMDFAPRTLAIIAALVLVPFAALAFKERGMLLLGLILLPFDGSTLVVADRFAITGSDWLFVAILGFRLVSRSLDRHYRSHRIAPLRGTYILCVGLFVLWATARWLQNQVGYYYLGDLTRIITSMGFFYLWAEQDSIDGASLLTAVTVAVGMVTLLGTAGFLTQGINIGSSRLSSPNFLDNPNTIGQFLILLGPVLWVGLAIVRNTAMRITIGAVVFSYFVTLVLTQSRGAWFGSVLQLVVGLLFIRSSERAKYIFLTVLVIIISGFIFSAVLGVSPFQMVYSRFGAMALSSNGIVGNRSVIWEASLSIIAANPLLGSSVAVPFSVQWVAMMIANLESGSATSHAHNLYLTLIATHGLIGFSLLMILLTRLLKQVGSFCLSVRRKLREAGTSRIESIQLLAVGFALGLMGELAYSAFEYTFAWRQVETLFWVVCGILVALTRPTAELVTDKSHLATS